MKCRHCGAEVSLTFVDLATAPPSNAYVTADQLSSPETWYPLRVLVCERCWLVQTEDYAHHAQLFSSDYAYFSSFSSTWLEHARSYVSAMVGRLGLNSASRVIEVASNDGYLLQYVQERNIPCLGIEPTASTAAAARSKGIEVVTEFFGTALAEQLVAQGRTADLTAANNVLAHVPDINDFVAGFARLLKPDGVATFEFPHLLRLVEQCQFDTIYHEHFSYLSLSAVSRIFEANGLTAFDVEELDVHGGSLRVFAQRQQARRPVMPAVNAMLGRESAAGMTTAAYYAGFQARANAVKDGLLRFLLDAKSSGQRVAAYGAAAKGNTLLNYAGVRTDLIAWVVDRNPAKQDKYLPGSRIPIVDEARIRAEKPQFIVILPWNLRREVVDQLHYIREWGGRFVTAVPQLVIQ
jgi:SAM-dependent methyltransferase